MPNSIFQSVVDIDDVENGTSAEDSFLDYATTGVASAGVSAVTGLYNSLVGIGKSFGAEGSYIEEEDAVEDVLGSDAKDFYLRHKTGIDAAGFIGGAIIPYWGASRAVAALASRGILTEGLSAATGLKNADYILGSKQVDMAKKAIMADNSFTLRQDAVYRAYATGAVGMGVEVALGEAAVLLFNNQNAMLNPDDLSAWESFSKNGWETLTSPLFYGGAIAGGVFKGLQVTGELRTVFSEATKKANERFQASVEGIAGLPAGDAAAIMAQELRALKDLEFTSSNGGVLTPFEQRRKDYLMEGFKLKLQEVASKMNPTNDPTVGAYLQKIFLAEEPDFELLGQKFSGAERAVPITQAERDRLANFYNRTIVPSTIEFSAEDFAGNVTTLENVKRLMQANGYSPEEVTKFAGDGADILINFKPGTAGYQVPDFGVSPFAPDSQKGLFRFFVDDRGKLGLVPTNFIYMRNLSKQDVDLFNRLQRQFGLPEMTKEAQESFTLLHELHHLKSNSKQAMNRIRQGMVRGDSLADEVIDMSYKARKLHWDQYLQSLGIGSIDDFKQAIIGNPAFVMNNDYMKRASELLADAGALMSGPRAEYWGQKAPTAAKLFAQFGALKVPFQMREGFVNVKTGESLSGLMPFLSDYRKFTIEKNGLKYANGGVVPYNSQVFNFTDDFRTPGGDLKLDLEELDEQWAIGSQYEFSTLTPTIESFNLPLLERAYELKLTPIVDGKSLGIVELEKFILDKKKDLQLRLAQTQNYNEEAIAKILNIKGASAGIGLDAPKEEWLLYGSRDYTEPQHIKVNYRNESLPEAAEEARSWNIMQQRAKMQHDVRMRAFSQVIGEKSEQFPNMPTVSDISEADTRQGFIFSLRTRIGSFREAAAYVGNLAQRLKVERGQAIETAYAAIGRTLNHPNSVVERAEVATWDSLGNNKKLIFFEVEEKLPDGSTKIRSYFGDVSSARKTPYTTDEAIELYRQNLLDATEIKSPVVADFYRAHKQRELANYADKSALGQGNGKYVTYNPHYFRPAPRRLQDQRFYAFVIPRELQKGKDASHYMIFADTEAEFSAKMQAVKTQYGDDYIIESNKGIGDFKKLVGDYENSGGFREIEFDASKLKEYKTGEIAPNLDVNSSATMERYRFYHQRQSEYIVNSALELRYAPEIEQLRRDGMAYGRFIKDSVANKSVFKAIPDNIYDDTVKLMLGVTNKGGPLGESYKRVSDFIGENFSAVIDTFARTGVIGARRLAPVTEAQLDQINQRLDDIGFKSPYADLTSLLAASPATINTRSFNSLVRFANGLVSTLMLPLDMANSVVQIISTPILLAPATREAIKASKAARDLMHVKVPGTNVYEPTPMKLFMEANKFMWTDDGKKWIEALRDRGLLPDTVIEYREAMDFSSFNGAQKLGEWTAKVDKLRSVAGKYTGYNFSEDYSRILAAYAGKKLGELMGKTGEELFVLQSSMIDKVNAVHRVTQRGTFFQGVVGQAVGLFQSYSLNWMQNMVRNIQQKDTANVLIQGALQASIFGVRSLPGFRDLNVALGEMNSTNDDIYTVTDALEPGSAGQYLLYGLGSHVLGVPIDLYNRGDTNPRNALLFPTTIAEIPAVSIVSKSITNAWQMLGNVLDPNMSVEAKKQALLHGIAHNGFNRPLQGIGTIWAGQVTTKDAKVLYANSNYEPETPGGVDYSTAEDWNYGAIFTRFLGTKPLQESILLDNKYRTDAYKANSKANAAALGADIKLAIQAGENITPEMLDEFTLRYERGGSDVEGFNAFLGKQILGAQEDSVLMAYEKLQDKKASAGASYQRMLNERSAVAPWQDLLQPTEDEMQQQAIGELDVMSYGAEESVQ